MKIEKGIRQDIHGNDVTNIYPNMPQDFPVEQIIFSACIEAHPSVIFNIETDANGKPYVRDNSGNWHSPDDARELAKALLIAADISEGKEPRDYVVNPFQYVVPDNNICPSRSA